MDRAVPGDGAGAPNSLIISVCSQACCLRNNGCSPREFEGARAANARGGAPMTKAKRSSTGFVWLAAVVGAFVALAGCAADADVTDETDDVVASDSALSDKKQPKLQVGLIDRSTYAITEVATSCASPN